MRQFLVVFVAFALAASACGGSPTGPSMPIPTLTFTVNGVKELVIDIRSDPTVPLVFRWDASNAPACVASGARGWSGDKPPSGTAELPQPGGKTIYALACTGQYGTVRASVEVSYLYAM